MSLSDQSAGPVLLSRQELNEVVVALRWLAERRMPGNESRRLEHLAERVEQFSLAIEGEE